MVLRCVEELLHSLTFYLLTIDFYFCNAEDEEIKILEDYLDIYGEASSQLINYQKLEKFFNFNIHHDRRRNISYFFIVTKSMGTTRYLALPSIIGMKRKLVLGFIKDRLRKHINQWTKRNLSKARKEILFISMAQTIPAYCMSVFLLPRTWGWALEDDELILVGIQITT